MIGGKCTGRKWSDLAIPKTERAVGFKYLEMFNKAVLVKQAWRLVAWPNSLCEQVLKGKYFHGTDFMSAMKRRNSSHNWRAILFGREALGHGMDKRVGDGNCTRVWGEPWIPDNPGFKSTVRLPNANAVMAEDLIDPISGT